VEDLETPSRTGGPLVTVAVAPTSWA